VSKQKTTISRFADTMFALLRNVKQTSNKKETFFFFLLKCIYDQMIQILLEQILSAVAAYVNRERERNWSLK
jgi:hypothetical protein